MSKDSIESLLQKKLKPFEAGNVNKHGFGFRVIEFPELSNEITSFDLLKEIRDNLIIVEFKYEKYGYVVTSIDKFGDPIKEKKLSNIIYSHLLFYYPRVIYIKGSKESANFIHQEFFKATEKIINILNLEELDYFEYFKKH
ncbi:MAG: hypothetical protein GF364_13015 [Candidatus Lokiarchaeota archaeon]|nr:hypothetical protein [Candidatus Lokiarchaeota archaeon]